MFYVFNASFNAWHVWGVFEANMGNIDMGRKLLKIGHNLNPRDAVLLQSLALLEYQYSTANVARVLFRRASELNPRHQPVWFVRNFFSWILSVLNIIIQIFIPFCMICCEVSLTWWWICVSPHLPYTIHDVVLTCRK